MCIAFIRRFVSTLSPDQIFTTKQVLVYGHRASVDSALWRLVKSGRIIRLARGVFIREDAKTPSAWNVAKVKCNAFGKQIAKHGSTLLQELEQFFYSKTYERTNLLQVKLKDTISSSQEQKHTTVFASNGKTSSFWFGETLIRIKGISPRKMQLNQSPLGEKLAALWHLGRNEHCAEYSKCIKLVKRELIREQRQQTQLSHPFIPEWLNKHFLTDWYKVALLDRRIVT
jgi:hypothetical protein